MKITYNGETISEILTNHSMTLQEALYLDGYDINDPDDLARAYDNGEPWAYIDDNGEPACDWDSLDIVS